MLNGEQDIGDKAMCYIKQVYFSETGARRYAAQARDMYRVLKSYGLMASASHIQPQGFPPMRLFADACAGLEGHGLYYCKPAKHSNKHNSAHRLFVECSCGKWVPFGRIVQHRKARNHP